MEFVSWLLVIFTMEKITLTVPIPKIIANIVLWFVLRYRKKHYGFTFRRIKLTGGKFAIVDPEDFEELNAYKWHAAKGGHTFYAIRSIYNKGHITTVKMHRQIINPPDGRVVDHKNHEGLDNRKANLRPATRAQNCWNSINLPKKDSSRYRGVRRDKDGDKWRAVISVNGKHVHLGYFTDENEAAKAYDAAAKKYRGEFAVLNFV